MRRLVSLFIGLLAIAAVGAAGWWAIDRFAGEDEPDQEADELTLVTARVVRTDLVERETLEGTLRFADPATVFAPSPGTVTALPDVGTVLGRGDRAYEVGGFPVVVMLGERPVWRTMRRTSDDGPDIRQLEENLVALGYDDEDLTVDEDFTSLTEDLVARWQDDSGFDDTGVVELGQVIFLQRPARVTDLLVEPGTVIAPGTPVLAVSSTTQEIQLWLDADRQDLLTEGASVVLELPDETVTSGVVRDIDDVVTTLGVEPEVRRAFEVIIALDDPSVASGLDAAPVDVDVVTETARDVLAVPVNALLALAEGGYAVEVRRADGSTSFVGVDIGSFADGLVAVTGDIAEGDVVLVPR